MAATPTKSSYLGYHHDIRFHSAILDTKHATRPSEPALHLINDEKQSVFVAYGAQSLQECRWRGNVPTFSEHGLDNDRCSVRRCRLLREQQLHLVQRSAHELGLVRTRRGVEMVPIREWRGQHTGLATHRIRQLSHSTRNGKRTHHERRKAVSVDGLALRDCHSAEGPSVKRALHGDDVLLASDAAHHLECGLNRF